MLDSLKGMPLLLLGLITSLTNCAISTNMPTNRFDSPEAVGKLGNVRVSPGAYQASHDLILTDDYTLSAPNANHPQIKRSDYLYTISAGIGLTKKLELGLKSPWGSPSRFQLKYQIFGVPKHQASKGDFSMAITSAIGFSENSDDSKDLVGQRYKYEMDLSVFDGSFLMGYRLIDSILMYAGPFYTRYLFDGTWEEVGQRTKDFSGHANNYGANVGFQFDLSSVFSLKTEGGWAKSVSGSTAYDAYHGGVQVELYF